MVLEFPVVYGAKLPFLGEARSDDHHRLDDVFENTSVNIRVVTYQPKNWLRALADMVWKKNITYRRVWDTFEVDGKFLKRINSGGFMLLSSKV